MPEITQTAGLDNTVNTCYAPVPSGIFTVAPNDRHRGNKATYVIQKWYRSNKRTKELNLLACAFNIHKWHECQRVRWHILCYAHVCATASTIRKWYQIMKRLNIMVQYAQLYVADATKTQWRRKQVMEKRMQKLTKRNLAAKIVKKWLLKRKTVKAIDNYLSLKNKALKIQKWYRAHLKSKSMLEYAKKYKAATILQRQFRTHRKIKAINRYLVFNKNALLIQNWYKRIKNRQNMIHNCRINAAALLIQSWYKRSKKIKCILHYISMNSAAFKIQQWYRIHSCSKKIAYHAHALVAVRTIQNWYSVCLKRRSLDKYLTCRSRTSIQMNYKEYWKYARVYHLQRQYISAIPDKYHKEREFVLQYLKMDAAALVIQSWYRNCKKRESIMIYVNNQGAIAKQERNYNSITRWKHAIELVQEKLRKEKSKAKLKPPDEETEVSLMVSQRAYRAWSAIKRTAVAVGESLQNWFFSKNLSAVMKEDSGKYDSANVSPIESTVACTENAYECTKKQICPACATLKLSRLQSKIRIASLIFVSETSVVMIQRWWRRIKTANAILKEAEKLITRRITC